MKIFSRIRGVAMFTVLMLLLLSSCENQTQPKYTNIEGWPQETNAKIEEFLNSTLDYQDRKVAVFDGDGTVFGQVPHYLADEALYQYAEKSFKGKDDSLSLAKLKILDEMIADGDNVGKPYVENRVHFLAGLSPDEIAQIGTDCFEAMYKDKFYPEMKALIANLKEFGFEVWILTASPEYLYQGFFAKELGISTANIIGARSVVEHGKTTSKIILPIPQDDGKANSIPTFIKIKPLIVGGNSRGDMDMINESAGLKIVVNPDDVDVRGPKDGPMNGHTVKSYWEKEGAVIVNCNDVRDTTKRFLTGEWKIRENIPHPKN